MTNNMTRNGSLSRQLIVALSLVIGVVGVIHGLSSYAVARADTNMLLDTRLSDVAIRLSAGMADIIMPIPEPGLRRPEDLEIQVWTGDEPRPSRATDPSIKFRRDAPMGFSNQIVAGVAWRVFTVRTANRTFEVGQRSEIRRGIAETSALKNIWPTIILIPLIWVAVILVVRGLMTQLNELAGRVQTIDLDRLRPISREGVPEDLLPFVKSINLLIERLAQMIESEKKFISDAAHELRSPIAALQLQADNLRHSIYPANVERFEELRRGIIRGGNLVTQMLQLARADAQVDDTRLSDVRVREVVTDVIADSLPIAMARGIDLGVEHLDEATVRATETDLRVVVKNLVDNAIRYSPDGSTIDVRVVAQAGRVSLEVADQGPGIAPESLTRVFERFVRVGTADIEGTGLGLAIVRATVSKYGGSASVANRVDGQTGLIARAEFPTV
jgi:two-component system OmpR family sensor kinase